MTETTTEYRTQTRRRVLMVAFHFPPLAGSSGVQRTLRFVQHLPAYGWDAQVLSASPRAYERVSEDLAADIPAGTPVERAFALDAARHLSLRGRYWAAMARPDRWTSWRFDAIFRGMRMIKRYRPDVLWSTYPTPTAHLIGAELSRRSGLPWVADFRDPMAQNGFPADPITWQQFDRIERQTLDQAARCVFTTPSAAREYQQRYPEATQRIRVIENGYDDESFVGLPAALNVPLNPGAITLLHSGIVYGVERDPTQLMGALRLLHDRGVIQPGRLVLRFRASAVDDFVQGKAEEFGVQDYIQLCPAIPYRLALQEMLQADGLLIMQASNCNAQIPAKIYEYLRAGRPMLCLTDPAGDTAEVARQAGISSIARLDDERAIASLIEQFIGPHAAALKHTPRPDAVTRASRAGRAEQLAALLNEL